ncbi:MAG: hypothetical protein HN417_06855 [Desulfobacula sp.]|jgi:hypothetical protein|nr:hypothetical protein [Desulfobacula sp.]MBT4967402.1 hypothetical protein [Bacteroidota bacterium]MBT7261387.1 hypothetical protein [Desulfobacula sp.]
MERKVLTTALNAFEESIGIEIETELKDLETIVGDFRADAYIKIQIREIELKFCVEVKPFVNRALLGILLNYRHHIPYEYKQLLVTKFVNPTLAEELKQNDINFIDMAGNVYINCFPIIFFIKGKKDKALNFKSRGDTPFTKTGLKLIYALLRNQNLIVKPHRVIANHAGVALGTVGNVIQNLGNQGHVIKMGRRGEKIVDKKALLDRWCLEYPERLKYKMLLGRFEGPADFWKYAPLKVNNAQWGGEVAAYKLTKYLKPEEFIIYADEEYLTNIIIQNRLRKTEDGNIFIFQQFWPEDTYFKKKDIVHPILIYADLLEFKNQRKIETAKLIYDKHILGHFT